MIPGCQPHPRPCPRGKGAGLWGAKHLGSLESCSLKQQQNNNRTAGKRCRDFGSNDEPRPSPPVGGMRHQATASRPPAASSRRLLARLRGWSRGRRRARSEIARGSTRPARASSDRRDPGRLLPQEVAHARTSRLPLLFSWALWRTVPLGSNCVSRPTRLSPAKCALKALGADFIVFVHARFLG